MLGKALILPSSKLKLMIPYNLCAVTQNYELSEYEAQIFLPAIIEKSGHNHVRALKHVTRPEKAQLS